MKGYVNDYADLISSPVESTITQKLEALDKSDSTQIFFLTIPSLEGMDIESYSMKVAETWKPGQSEFDNGILFTVSMSDRKMRIEVGYGLEGVVTDLLSGRIIDHIAAPSFKEGDYDKGFNEVADALISVVKGEYENNRALSGSTPAASGDEGIIFILMMIVYLLTKVAGSISKTVGAVTGAVLGAVASLIAGIFNPFFILLFALAGFGLSFIPFSVLMLILLSSSRGSGGSSGSSGGGFSGGGGGSFGGGGASGGW